MGEIVIPLPARLSVALTTRVLRDAALQAHGAEVAGVVQHGDELRVTDISPDDLLRGLTAVISATRAEIATIEEAATLHDDVISLDPAQWWRWERLQERLDHASTLRQIVTQQERPGPPA